MNSESSDLTPEDRDAPPMTDHDHMNYWWRRATQAEQRIRDLTQEARDERAACLDQIEQVQARDARIQAVRELHYHDVFRGHLDNGCAICGHDYPCPTIRALDGER